VNCRPALENPGLDSRESEEPKRSVEASNESVPLFVDLDGTLLQTDLLFESLLSGVKRDPALLLKLPGWLLKGRAYLKRRIAERCDIDVSTLPYREPLCEFLRAEAANGRSIYLATASDRLLAEAVAGHLGFFSGVLASDGANNLKGKRKLAAIQAMTNGAPFEYAGNGSEDLEIWTAAHGAIVVAAPPAVAAAA
jgi:phosphoserine phosphatase